MARRGVRGALKLARQSGWRGSDVANQEDYEETLAKVLSSEVVFSSKVFECGEERVIEPQGVKATRDIIEHPGSVVVLPVFPDGRILMIRQYRHSVGQYLWELVAGRRDGEETFARGAHRELQEETGYTARKMRQLVGLYPESGIFAREDGDFSCGGVTGWAGESGGGRENCAADFFLARGAGVDSAGEDLRREVDCGDFVLREVCGEEVDLRPGALRCDCRTGIVPPCDSEPGGSESRPYVLL